MKIIALHKLSSTEDYLRKRLKRQQKNREDLAVVAEIQMKGRGTKDRSFSSNEGGAYLSFVRFHNALLGSNAYKITQFVSVAVVRTLYSFGVKAQIKWPNDVLVKGKKIAGMLIENSFVGDYLDYSLVGVGINVNNALPEDLEDTATTLSSELGRKVDLKVFIATFLYNLRENDLNENVLMYPKFSAVLGKEVRIIKPDGESYLAVVKEILADGRLLLDSGEKLSSAEISLRI